MSLCLVVFCYDSDLDCIAYENDEPTAPADAQPVQSNEVAAMISALEDW